MALAAIKITVGQSLGEGRYSVSPAGASVPASGTLTTDVAALVAAKVSTTAVAAAVATLVSDAASPTQAHVTTLNTAWGTLATACTTLNTAVDTVNTDAGAITTAISGDVLVQWDGSVVTHRNQVRAALRRALEMIEAGYGGLAE